MIEGNKELGNRETAGWHWFVFTLKNNKMFLAQAQLSPYFIDWKERYPDMLRLRHKTTFVPTKGGIGLSTSIDCQDVDSEVLLPKDNLMYVSNAGKELRDTGDKHWNIRTIFKATPKEKSKILRG